MLAAVVVLPTPPFPEVMHTTRESLPMLRVPVMTLAREARCKSEPTLAAPSARLEALDKTNAICCEGRMLEGREEEWRETHKAEWLNV